MFYFVLESSKNVENKVEKSLKIMKNIEKISNKVLMLKK
jgi:hypothetical protein